jgi:hypothetical protein
MRLPGTLTALSLVSLLLVAALSAQDGAKASAFRWRDLNDVEHRPFADPKVKAVALIFLLADCPIANSYAGEIKRLCNEYERRGVRFYLVQVDPDLTVADARQHARDYGFPCPVVLDREHKLVQHAGATRVPEAVVFSADGERRYRGRIDDLYVAPGKRRTQPTARDLRAALDAILAGEPVPRPTTATVGCYIPPLTRKGPER